MKHQSLIFLCSVRSNSLKILLCSSIQFLLYLITPSFFSQFQLAIWLEEHLRISRTFFFFCQSDAEGLCSTVSVLNSLLSEILTFKLIQKECLIHVQSSVKITHPLWAQWSLNQLRFDGSGLPAEQTVVWSVKFSVSLSSFFIGQWHGCRLWVWRNYSWKGNMRNVFLYSVLDGIYDTSIWKS